MKAIVFDVETTGLPKKKGALPEEIQYWPHVVQISWLVFDTESRLIEKVRDYIIRLPSHIFIPPASTKIHGIDRLKSDEEGIDIKCALQEFTQDLCASSFLIAHNIEFDRSVLGAEYHRNGLINWLARFRGTRICTMKLGNAICDIKYIHPMTGKKVSKYPKLMELHQHLFKSIPNNLHNSLVDIYVCFRCFYKLVYEGDYCLENPRFSRKYKLLCRL